PFHHLLQLRAAGFDEVFADRTFLQPIRFAELPYGFVVVPRAQAGHQLLPHRLSQRLPAMEHLIAAQAHFLVLCGPHARPLDRHLLPHHDGVALLTAPSARLAILLTLTSWADYLTDFFLHQQFHDLQTG